MFYVAIFEYNINLNIKINGIKSKLQEQPIFKNVISLYTRSQSLGVGNIILKLLFRKLF
jgi:hypothetical protein